MMTRAARTLEDAPTVTGREPVALPELSLPRRRTSTYRWLAGAAAVVALAVVGVTAAGVIRDDDGRLVDLQAVTDSGVPVGDSPVQVVLSPGDAATRVTFVAAGLPAPAADEFYEAWLLDPATEKMLPLGVVAGGSDATFEVANSLLDQYDALDLSLEVDDGDPGHSATSVLRGTY